jgi:hypothetical protein
MNFPLLAITIKFFNHPEMMIKNAVRIIIISILKLNDPHVNRLLVDIPFVNFFCHLACYLRDKIIEIDSIHNP